MLELLITIVITFLLDEVPIIDILKLAGIII